MAVDSAIQCVSTCGQDKAKSGYRQQNRHVSVPCTGRRSTRTHPLPTSNHVQVNRIRETPCATLAPLWNEGANHIMIDMTDWNRWVESNERAGSCEDVLCIACLGVRDINTKQTVSAHNVSSLYFAGQADTGPECQNDGLRSARVGCSRRDTAVIVPNLGITTVNTKIIISYYRMF